MVALREILCATDLETPDRAALRYAFFIAETFECPLHVAHVWDAAGSRRSNTYVSAAQRMERALAAHRLRERLEVIVRAVPTGALGRARTHVEEGSLAETLLNCAERQRADLMVLGASARGDRSSRTHESVAMRLIDTAACPILTVPDFDLAVAPRVQRLLLALESAPTGGRVAEWIALLARRFDAVVHIVYGETPRSGGAASTVGSQRALEETLRRAGVGVASTSTESGPRLGERALSLAELERCDMIAVSAKPRSDRSLSLFGDLHSRSALPVFSVRDVAPDRLFVDSGVAVGIDQ